MKNLTIINNIIKELQNEIPNGILITTDTKIKNNDTERSILRIDFQDKNIPIAEISMDEIEAAVRNNEISEDEAAQYVRTSIKEAMNSIYGAKTASESITRESILNTVLPVVVNNEQNTCLKESVPYKTFLDLMVYYEIQLKGMDGCCTAKITDEHLKGYGITEKELIDAARTNLEKTEFRILDCTNPLSEPIAKFTDETAHDLKKPNDLPTLFTLKNDNYKNANVLLCKNILRAIADKFDNGFWILPSSIHEIIISNTGSTPNNEDEWNQINNVVQSVNTQIVNKDEILSDHAYYYDHKTHTIFMTYEEYTNQYPIA